MVEVLDFRYDTLVPPDEEMRRVMARAEVGDDVLGEDPSVQALQLKVASLLGKEAALFLPSGIMANIIGVLNHSGGRGSRYVVGDQSHIFRKKDGGVPQLAGIDPVPITNEEDGTFSLEALQETLESEDPDHRTIGVICIENTHNMMGGKVLPLEWMEKLGSLCRSLKLPIHMDGARLLNAAVALRVPPARLTKDCDTVMLCLNKGPGAPVGSVIAGSKDFIDRAVLMRRCLGGGMTQCGMLAAAGALALDRCQYKLPIDHTHAKIIATVSDKGLRQNYRESAPFCDVTFVMQKAVRDAHSSVVTADVNATQTNIVMLNCDTDKMTPEELQDKLMQTKCPEDVVSIKALAVNCRQVRLVTHRNLPAEVARACQKIVKVITT